MKRPQSNSSFLESQRLRSIIQFLSNVHLRLDESNPAKCAHSRRTIYAGGLFDLIDVESDVEWSSWCKCFDSPHASYAGCEIMVGFTCWSGQANSQKSQIIRPGRFSRSVEGSAGPGPESFRTSSLTKKTTPCFKKRYHPEHTYISSCIHAPMYVAAFESPCKTSFTWTKGPDRKTRRIKNPGVKTYPLDCDLPLLSPKIAFVALLVLCYRHASQWRRNCGCS